MKKLCQIVNGTPEEKHELYIVLTEPNANNRVDITPLKSDLPFPGIESVHINDIEFVTEFPPWENFHEESK